MEVFRRGKALWKETKRKRKSARLPDKIRKRWLFAALEGYQQMKILIGGSLAMARKLSGKILGSLPFLCAALVPPFIPSLIQSLPPYSTAGLSVTTLGIFN